MLRKLLQQGASVATIRVLGTGMGVAISIVLARAFGTEALGVYSFCIALFMLATVPISYGWAGMLLRSVAREGRLDGMSRAMARYGAVGAVGMALLAAVVGYVALRIGRTDIATLLEPVALGAVGLLAVALLADQVSALRMASLRGIDRPTLAQLPEMVLRPTFLIAGIGALWFFYGPDGLAQTMLGVFAAVALAALLSALFGQVLLSRVAKLSPPRRVDPLTQRHWIASAAALAGSAGLVQLNGYVDLLLLGGMRDADEVGLYRAGLQIAMLANFGYIALNMLAGQRFSNLLAKGDKQAASQTGTHLSRLALLTAIPVPIALLIGGEWIFGFLFGADFAPSALPALIVSLGFCFSATIGMAHALLIMSHGEFIAIRLTAVALATNVMLCLLLIPAYGMLGAAVSNVVASALWNVLLWYFARKRTGIDPSAVGLIASDGTNG
ncbi:oligosaccharide flippase family protein [Aurantiacibacter gilvus]|uniref:Oligosaccharide flippase family protein n=1 Tax=Aurantiacibacter gilvus TaxID=3139141 RepID=A0ABU9IGL7_9SPHN